MYPTLPKFVVEMARRQAVPENPELQQFVLPEAHPTGKQLGRGSYGVVVELRLDTGVRGEGLVCAGKRIYESLLEPDNIGVGNIERKYLEECQVKPKTITNYLLLSVTLASDFHFVVGDGEDAASPRSTVLGPVLFGRVNASHAGDGANGQQPR